MRKKVSWADFVAEVVGAQAMHRLLGSLVAEPSTVLPLARWGAGGNCPHRGA